MIQIIGHINSHMPSDIDVTPGRWDVYESLKILLDQSDYMMTALVGYWRNCPIVEIPLNLLRSTDLLRRYMNIIIKILDIIHRAIFYLNLISTL
jgi:hypothetical protein